MFHPFSNFISYSNTNPYIQNTQAPTRLDTGNKVRPLPANGYLVKESIFQAPFTMVKDFGKDVKNIGKGLNGDLNDHDLGRLNDVGMKLGGLSIACYLAAKKTPMYQKAMEFVGFGTFFATMALWPKLMIEKPIEWMHGINVHQKYVDSHGRKKMFFQDPQYLPWDLYTHEEIEKLGDKMGIPKDLPNRQDTIKETAQKKAIQANTLWMWTAGFATPLMTAMACSAMQPTVKQVAENYKVKKATNELQHVEQNFAKYIDENAIKARNDFEDLLSTKKGQEITSNLIEEIADKLTGSHTFTAQENIMEDVKKLLQPKQEIALVPDWNKILETPNMLNNNKRFTPNHFLKQLKISGQDAKDRVIEILNETMNELGITQFDNENIENFKNKLGTNLKKIVPNDDSCNNFVSTIYNVVKQTKESNSIPKLTQENIKQLKEVYSVFEKINATNELIRNHLSTFVGAEEDSVLSLQWTKTINKLIKDMEFNSKQLHTLHLFSNSDGEVDKIVMDQVEKIIGTEPKYNKIMTHLIKGVREYDSKLSRELMTETFEPLEKIHKNIAESLDEIGFNKTANFHIGKKANRALNQLRYEIYEAIGLSKKDFDSKLLFDILTSESILRTRIAEIAKDPQETAKVVKNIESVLKEYSGARAPLAEAIKNNMNTNTVPTRKIVDVAIEKLPIQDILQEVNKQSLSTKSNYCIEKLKEAGVTPQKLMEDKDFVSNMPEFIDNVVFKSRKLHDKMIYDGGMKEMIPEWSDRLSGKIPEEADRVYTNLIRSVRDTFLRENGIKKDAWNNTLLGMTDDLADAFANFRKNQFSEKQLGARACLYRTIQVFDLIKRIKNGTLEKQCEKFVNEYLQKADKRLSSDERTKFVKELMDECKKHILESDIVEHTAKFDLYNIHPNGGDYYNLVMKTLFETELDSSTKSIIEKIDPPFLKRFATYKEAVIEQVGNDINRFMKDSHMGNPLLRRGNPFIKHLLIAQSFVKQIKNAVTTCYGNHKWFKIFGTMSAGLVGITLLADAFLLKTPKSQYSKVVKGKDNVQNQLSV